MGTIIANRGTQTDPCTDVWGFLAVTAKKEVIRCNKLSQDGIRRLVNCYTICVVKEE
jgi:hypothetical protein